MTLTIVADIHATDGNADALFAALQALVAPTRAEPGCLHYDLHRDNADPGHFLFHESWETRDAWLAHNVSDHIKAHQRDNAALVASATIHEMTRV